MAEKQFVIWEAPKKCSACKISLADISVAMTQMKMCPKCGFITPSIVVASESKLEHFKNMGFKVIREVIVKQESGMIT